MSETCPDESYEPIMRETLIDERRKRERRSRIREERDEGVGKEGQRGSVTRSTKGLAYGRVR